MRLDDLLISISNDKLDKIVKSIIGTTEKIAGGVYGTLGKIPRFELTERVKEQAVQSGLYHFVRDDIVADEIIKSEHLRPSSSVITSYGRKCAFLFCGAPSVDNYAKNMAQNESLIKQKLWEGQLNPYITPTAVATAIKFTPQKNDLSNYKFRGLQDGAFMYEGYCILPHEAVQKVKMVPDLVRDSSGNPVRDDNGEYQLAFREALPEELSQDQKTYNAKADYLQYIKEKSIEYGYLNKDGSQKSQLGTKLNVINDVNRMEFDEGKKSILQNRREIAQAIINRIKGVFQRNPSIEKSAEENLKDFSFRKKNPYRDKDFALAIADFQTRDGLTQLDLNDVLSDFTNSKDGEFFNKKYHQIEYAINKTGIHGKEHANRVALQSMIIARNEGILENDDDSRIKDILSTAAMYHDIGRVLNSAPHARNSARKIRKMDLRYSDGRPYSIEDKNIVMALVEAHEGKPDKIEKMIQKYHITDPKNIALAQRLNSVVRDADALDRVRIDSHSPFHYKANLKPQFLVNDTAKRLINAAYQLEFLTGKVPNINNILRFNRENNFVSNQKQINTFDEKYRVYGIDAREAIKKTLESQTERGEGNKDVNKYDNTK